MILTPFSEFTGTCSVGALYFGYAVTLSGVAAVIVISTGLKDRNTLTQTQRQIKTQNQYQ